MLNKHQSTHDDSKMIRGCFLSPVFMVFNILTNVYLHVVTPHLMVKIVHSATVGSSVSCGYTRNLKT